MHIFWTDRIISKIRKVLSSAYHEEQAVELFIFGVKGLKTLIYVAVGLYDTHSFEWAYLLKFLCTQIVKQFVILV